MASTLVPAIREKWPRATIGWVVGRGHAPFVQLIAGVDEVIEVADQLTGRHRMAAITALLAAWRRIGRRWDHVLIAHTDSRYPLLSAMSGAQTTTRFAHELAPRKGHWHGSEYLRLLPHEEFANVAANFASLNMQSLPAAPLVGRVDALIVVAPGSARNGLRDDALRRWPIGLWCDAVSLLRQHGHRVAAVGGPADSAECARAEQSGAINLCGRTSLLELLSVIRAADVVITHDAGPLHLALTLRRPVVALFGPTSPAERIPVGANAVVLTRSSDLACAPCYDGLNYAKCSLNLCLTRITAVEVANAAESLLASEFSSRSTNNT